MDQRSKLLECAQNLFAARGYDGVGVLEIAQAAGVTKPTLYHYFGSKHGLLESLLSETMEPFYEQLAGAAAYHGDLPKTLGEICSAYLNFADANPIFARMLLAIYFAPPDSESFLISKSHYARQQELLETMFEAASKTHGNMKGRYKRYAFTYIGIINSYVSMFLNGQFKVTNSVKAEIVQQFSHGIYS